MISSYGHCNLICIFYVKINDYAYRDKNLEQRKFTSNQFGLQSC